ncbi:MAG: hypothetical protein AAFQ43_07060, partial [Bacteroidota bacterium]
MLDALDAVGRASGEWLWMPLLAWSGLWLLAEAAHRAGARVHPLVRYRTTQAALFALPVGLAVSPLLDPSVLAPWLNPPVVVDMEPVALGALTAAPDAALSAPLAPEAAVFTVWAGMGLLV